MPAVTATNSISQTTINNSRSALKFDSESFDSANMHPNSGETRKLITPSAGIYHVEANVTVVVEASQNSGTSLSVLGKATTRPRSSRCIGSGPAA